MTYKKIKNNNSKGISSKIKLVIQILLALLSLFIFYNFIETDLKTNLYFPFFKNLIVNLGWFFIPFYLFVIVGSSNAVNLTDGLDGLATVPVILVAGCFRFHKLCIWQCNFCRLFINSLYRRSWRVSVFCGAIIGASIGFLWFNAPPAKIFMGDTGSLALGGSLGAME